MADIHHDFPVAARPDEVFRAVSTTEGLAVWWSQEASGEPGPGAEIDLSFGPGYEWRARAEVWEPGERIEWRLTRADDDWVGTCVCFDLEPTASGTRVSFRHTGWREKNAHYRTSCFCWAMYLRLMKRWVERGERVAYGERLEA